LTNLGQRRLPALIFRSVVQQRGDGLGLGATGLDHVPGHRQQVTQVRDIAALSRLVPALIGRVRKRGVEFLYQRDHST
jgi:hypothetical protein